jgi:hypothetical protein
VRGKKCAHLDDEDEEDEEEDDLDLVVLEADEERDVDGEARRLCSKVTRENT